MGVLERIGKGLVSFGTATPQIELDRMALDNESLEQSNQAGNVALKQQQTQISREQEMRRLQQAARTDPAAMERLMYEFPEVAQMTIKSGGLLTDQQQEQAEMFLTRYVNEQDPQRREQLALNRMAGLSAEQRDWAATADLVQMSPEQADMSARGMLSALRSQRMGAASQAPSDVRTFQYFEEELGDPNNPDVLTEAQKRFLQSKRATSKVTDVKGVPSVVDVTDSQVDPLSTIQEEASAAGAVAGAEEAAKQAEQINVVSTRDQEQAKLKLPDMRAAKERTTSLIDSILTDPDLPHVVGFFQGRVRGLNGKQRALVKKIEQLQGKAFLEAFESLKGGGTITEIEGKAATDAQTRINDRTMDEGSFKEALLDMRNTSVNAYTRLQDKAAVPRDDFQEMWNSAPSGAVLEAPDGTLRRKP